MNYTKRIITALCFLGLVSVMTAQDCDGYYPMKKGVTYELTSYDKKDRLKSVTKNTVKDVYNKDGSKVAVLHTVATDSHNKETLNADYNMYCDGKKITVDINTLLRERMVASMAKNGSDIDTDITGENLQVPINLEVGQELPDSNMKMEVTSGTLKMDFGAKRYNRKVIGSETITVPAGTFDCMIISENVELKLMITKRTESKTWMAKGVGVVKSEVYDKKGRLSSREELTLFEK